MKKLGFGILIAVVGVILVGSVASALPTNLGTERAGDVSPALATVPFPQLSESELTKIVFIRYAPGLEPFCNGNSVCDPKENWKSCPSDCTKGGGEEEPPVVACYDFLAGSKPHWNWVEDYYYSGGTLGNSSAAAVSTWEGATSGEIFGNGISGTGPWGEYDLKNSIVFGDYPEEGVIGVTAVWYLGKNIYEYDILFDTDYFPGGGIDLDTVVLHEFGHGAGLDDLYDTVCTTEVMYGIYDGVDLNLGPGDTTGIQILYGI